MGGGQANFGLKCSWCLRRTTIPKAEEYGEPTRYYLYLSIHLPTFLSICLSCFLSIIHRMLALSSAESMGHSMMSLSLFALASGSASVLSLASPSASDFHTRLLSRTLEVAWSVLPCISGVVESQLSLVHPSPFGSATRASRL